jgi:hypothetical protein
MSTLLEAVNVLLIARELVPVNTLDSGHPKAVSAQNILERKRKLVQAKKWWFNVEEGVQLFPDEDGFVNVPAGVMRLEDTDYTLMGGKLYKLDERTTVFTENPDEVSLVYNRDWEDMPEIPYNYIVSLAKEEFVRPMGDQLITRGAEKDIKDAFALMQIQQLEYDDVVKDTGNALVRKWREKMLTR